MYTSVVSFALPTANEKPRSLDSGRILMLPPMNSQAVDAYTLGRFLRSSMGTDLLGTRRGGVGGRLGSRFPFVLLVRPLLLLGAHGCLPRWSDGVGRGSQTAAPAPRPAEGFTRGTRLRRARDDVAHKVSVPDPTRQAYHRRMGNREERVAKNEATSRMINEGVEAAFESDPRDAFLFFICECGLEQCDRTVRITKAEYERVRGDPRQFVIFPNHLIAEAEHVVSDGDTFLVVAKREGTAAEVAIREDPRT